MFCCHRHQDLEKLVQSIGGFQLKELGVFKATFFLPEFFPTVWGSPILSAVPEKEMPWMAINIGRIFNPASGSLRSYDVRDYLGVLPSTKILLTFHVKDKLLSFFWRHLTEKTVFLASFAKLKVDLVCSPNFSNYFEAPKFGYFYNIKRSFICAERFIDLGFNVALDVSSPCESTDRFYLDYFNKLLDPPKYLSLNCQLTKLERFKKIAFQRFQALNQNLPKETEFIITGFCGQYDARRVYESCKGRKIHFTSSSAFMRALCRQALERAQIMDKEPEDLFRAYVKYYLMLHKALKESVETGKKLKDVFERYSQKKSG